MRVVKDFKALGRLWIRLAAAMGVLAVQSPTVAVANPFPYTLQWKRLVLGIGGGAVAWRDSLVYVGTTDGRVLAVGRADGVRRWQRRGLGPVRKDLAIAGADVLFGDAWGGVRRLAGADGVEVWAFQRQGWGDAAVALGAGL
ncbi:MAG: PQQ-binding-like beta-propeller repeat protein, partial [Candidatus Latescibacteria bacterium]|nr:PQQ-binding-like beta-propeller repeat protein [Candidatus Latescibacterota bacterium]